MATSSSPERLRFIQDECGEIGGSWEECSVGGECADREGEGRPSRRGCESLGGSRESQKSTLV